MGWVRGLLQWLFGPHFFDVGTVLCIAVGVAMALSADPKDVSASLWFFGVAAVFSAGRAAHWLATEPNHPLPKPLLAIILFGAIGALWITAHEWALRKLPHPTELATQPPTTPAINAENGPRNPPTTSENSPSRPSPEMPLIRLTSPSSTAVLQDPILHIEPERGFIEGSKERPGVFTVTINNTGLVDISRVDIYVDYFVAKKMPDIQITRVGAYSENPDAEFPLLRGSGHTKPVILDFSEKIEPMWQFAAIGNLPNVLGARIRVQFRRAVDGKEYEQAAVYGVAYQAAALYTPDKRGISAPPSMRPRMLLLSELEPYLLDPKRWSDAIFNVNTQQLMQPE